MLRSFKILFCLVLEAMDTSDSPLLRSFCVLASSIVFFGNVQFGTGPKLELGIITLLVLKNAVCFIRVFL